MKFKLRDATLSDVVGMLSIYNEVVETSTAIYSESLADADYMREYIKSRVADGFPVFVLESTQDESGENPTILGYGSYGLFRARPGYRFTVEHTVHIASKARGGGAGSALLCALIKRAKAEGYHVMVGAVDSANAPSLRFHKRAGFQIHSALPQVGRKFDRWLDMTFVTLCLAQEENRGTN